MEYRGIYPHELVAMINEWRKIEYYQDRQRAQMISMASAGQEIPIFPEGGAKDLEASSSWL